MKKNAEIIKVVLIVLAAVIAYANALHCGYVLDDFDLAVDNPNIKSWGNLYQIFTTGYWDAEGLTRGLYRPLAIFSFMLEYGIAGTAPWLRHLDNIILHAAVTVAAYFMLRKIFPRGDFPFWAAVLFAVHPAHTEAVTWVSGRAELMAALFSMLSILVFLRSDKSRAALWLSPVFFLFGLLSKETAAMTPAALIIILLFFDTGKNSFLRKMAVRLAPFAATFVVYMAARYIVLGHEVTPKGGDQMLYGLSAYQRASVSIWSFFEYARLSLLPFDLKMLYEFDPPGALGKLRTIAGSILLAGVGITFIISMKHRLSDGYKTCAFAASWFALWLFPVSNIIPVGVLVSERALYLPLLGTCLILASAVCGIQGLTSIPHARRLATASFWVVVLLMAGLAVERNTHWSSQDIMLRELIRITDEQITKYPDRTMPYQLKVRFYGLIGDTSPKAAGAVDALAAKAGDANPELLATRADLYLKQGRYEEAYLAIERAVEIGKKPRWYNTEATILGKLGRYEEALQASSRAIAMNPKNYLFYLKRGEILMESGRDAEAIQDFSAAAKLNPESHDVFLMKGISLDAMRRYDEAIASIKKAVSLRPDIADLHYFLAVAFLDSGNRDAAVKELNEALRIKPGYGDARALLNKLSR
ncbi:MAG TPA: tetratricopeptide repeat protein [Nitrospirota bacterium]